MKSTIQNTPKKPQYPKLKIYNKRVNEQIIVLFIRRNTGTIVNSLNKDAIGEFKNDWVEENFEEFSGQVVLEN